MRGWRWEHLMTPCIGCWGKIVAAASAFLSGPRGWTLSGARSWGHSLSYSRGERDKVSVDRNFFYFNSNTDSSQRFLKFIVNGLILSTLNSVFNLIASSITQIYVLYSFNNLGLLCWDQPSVRSQPLYFVLCFAFILYIASICNCQYCVCVWV